MGADGGMPVFVSRSNVISSSDAFPLPQFLSLEPISLGSQKVMRAGELRKALGLSPVSASEEHLVRVSSYKPSLPVATEDVKQYKENVTNASIKARERLKTLRNSIYKLDRYTESLGSRKKQRVDHLLNEKPGASNLSKTAVQLPRITFEQSAQKLEDRAKCAGTNKRFRTSTAEVRVDSKSSVFSKDQTSREKVSNITKPVNESSVQPEERILRLSAVGEGWDKNMKRKRSVGTVGNRLTDTNTKRTMQPKLSTNAKLASCDGSALRSNAKQGKSTSTPGTVIKGKISRAPRTGSVIAINSSDIQASSEACGALEQPTSTNKVISLGLMQNHNLAGNSSQMLGQWVGQRQQKSSRSRRTNVVSPVTNHDDAQMPLPSVNIAPPVGVRSSPNGNSGCFDSVDVHNSTPKSSIIVESAPSPFQISEGEETEGSEHKVEEKGTDNSGVALNGKGKVRAFLFPTKKNKSTLNENAVDSGRRQGRTVRGSSLSRPGVSQTDGKLEVVSMTRRVQNSKPSLEKIRSKTGRPPSKKMSDGRVVRNPESDDDHEELLAAAASARKANYLSCSGRFWKKIEPVFGSVSSQDISHLKQQLSLAKELEDNQYLIQGAQPNFLGAVTQKERADLSSGRKGNDFNNVINKDESLSEELVGGRSLAKFSSLYQRVMSALVDEDESEGFHNAYEGMSMSFQCASDDSHCGSCNYADAETKDRDRFDSEAESMVDIQIQKRYSGDRFSCNKSVTSNTTRNTSMSDSLYSSGRWLGDDGISYSDVEFVSGSCQNDLGGSLPVDATASGTFYDCQYQLMCVDDRLLLELQSIGLYPETMPDLAEGEVIDRDITELNEGLCEEIGKRKDNLVKIDEAIQVDREREKLYMEQVAMEQLIQMAYKRRMACRKNNASKTVMRKVSKQVAMGFIERTLARCTTFEVTGRSCFSESALQNIIFAAPQGTDVGVNIPTDGRTGHGAPKHLNTAKADSLSLSMPDSCIDELGRGPIDSPQVTSHSSEYGFPKLESASHKVKKREVLLDDVGGASSRGETAFGSSLTGGVKGKRRGRDRENSGVALMISSACETQSVGGFRIEQKPKKAKQKLASTVQQVSSSIQRQSTGNNTRARDIGLLSGNDPQDACEDAGEPVSFETMDQLGISNDPSAPDDLTTWLNSDELNFNDMQDLDCIGLEIPMDDLSMVI